MTTTVLIVALVLLFILELLYFRIADHFNIIDKPNHRSSHTAITLRGGGIIFSLALLLYPLWFGLQYEYFLMGLFAIAFISFMDDMKPVSNKVRIVFHLLGVALMFYQLGLFELPFYWTILALILVIGSINAINFMDGINGITGLYALVTLLTLYFINLNVIEFVNPSFILVAILSVIVFNFFNFRTRAKCFAGDVGSVSIAFIVMFFILALIIKTENFSYLLLLLVYGLDTVTTIVFRLMRKENIFEAHRSHFYQYWANERKYSHLLVSGIYGIGQLLFNLILIYVLPYSILNIILVLLVSVIIFTLLRFMTEGKERLLGH